MEIAAMVETELALSGLFRVMSILEENFRDVKTAEEMKPLNDFVDYKIEALIREAKCDDLVQLMPSLEKLQAAALELEDLLDFYEYDQIEKQVNFFSSEPVPKKKVLPTQLKNGLDKLLMIVEQVENKRQSITYKTDTSKPQADTVTPTMELAAKVGTELALSGLFRVASILDENFRDVKTIEEMKPLNDFVNYRFETLIREAKSDDLVQLMPLLEELQAAALELEDRLDLYEYEQIEKQVNSSSSEPIPKEQVLPGLNKLLMIVERVENKRQSITTSNSFIDFLVGETRVARPVIKLAISDISRVIEMLGSNTKSSMHYPKILEQLKDVVSYHIRTLIRNVDSNDSARSMKLLEMLKASSLQLDLLNPREFRSTIIWGRFDDDEYDYTLKAASSSSSIPLEKFKPKFKEESGTILHKSPLRIGLENLLKVVEQVEKKHPSITSSMTGTTQPQANIVTPSLRFGVEKWLKFVEQVEKEHPFIASTEHTAHPQDYTSSLISTTFSPSSGFLSITSLENGKCQEDAEEIMRNHKNNLKKLIFEWSDTASDSDKEVLEWTDDVASSTDTCKDVLERLEPDQNLEHLSIISYSYFKFPNWMEKENWLPRLQKLTLRSCTSLKIIPFLPPRLQSLEVEHCHELMQLPLASNTFRYIDLSDCPKLTSLGNLQRCTFLKLLEISKCPMLLREEVSVVEGVVEGDITNRLPRVVHISTDEPLWVLQLVQQLSSIKRLGVSDCAALALPNLVKLSSLESLGLRDCRGVESLPNLPVSLRSISIWGCPKLKEKYKEGGPLRNTISHIPHIDIY